MGYALISYSSVQGDKARALNGILQKNDIDVWIAPDDIPAGQSYAAAINAAIKNCDCVVLMLSDSAQNSPYVQREVENAIKHKKTIFPLAIEEVVLNEDFEFFLGLTQQVPVSQIDENDKNIIQVIGLIKNLFRKNASKKNSQKQAPLSVSFDETNDCVEEDVRAFDGDTICFGAYPQSRVTDDDLTEKLNDLAGWLPTDADPQKWTSYEYYADGEVQNYAWYIDIAYRNEFYRGVYFIGYRPYWTIGSNSPESGYQKQNGYESGTVYWFLYEPIKWRILTRSGNQAFILSEKILDAQQFDYKGEENYSNDYSASTIRQWLNDKFYDTAFSDEQKALIISTPLDNGPRSTNPMSNATQVNGGKNIYCCSNTTDKVFLPCMQDVTNKSYGFNDNYTLHDATRRKKTTEYARAQGAWTCKETAKAGNGCWWLRSPYYGDKNAARMIGSGGGADGNIYVRRTGRGIVPAMRIKLL